MLTQCFRIKIETKIMRTDSSYVDHQSNKSYMTLKNSFLKSFICAVFCMDTCFAKENYILININIKYKID